MEKKIKVIGKIGNTEYQNNDRCKVLSGGWCTKVIYSVCSHGDTPLVIKRFKKMKILGDIEVGGERGRVVDRVGCATTLTGTDYKDPQKVIKKYGKADNCTWRHRQN